MFQFFESIILSLSNFPEHPVISLLKLKDVFAVAIIANPLRWIVSVGLLFWFWFDGLDILKRKYKQWKWRRKLRR